MPDAPRWVFERIGLGYRVWAEVIETEIRVTRLKRSGGELHGEVRVTTNLDGVKTLDGIMHVARFNLSSSTTRNSLAKLLESRSVGASKKMDWFDGLEALCQQVMLAESIGQPYMEVGTLPIERKTNGYAIDPLVPSNVAAMLYGPSGSGKSVLALACAMSIRNGWEIIPGIPPAAHGPVLYLDWETDWPVINERIQSIATGAGIESQSIIYRRCIRPLAEEAEEIANNVAEKGIVYMVVDSAGMAIGGAGERGDANESTLRLFDAIRHINVSTQIVDHVSKQEMRSKGKTRGLLPYGSIYKINLARSSWEIRNGTTSDDEKVRVALIHTNANDSKLKDQIDLDIEWQAGSIAFKAATSVFREADEVEDAGGRADLIRDLLSDGAVMPIAAIISTLTDDDKEAAKLRVTVSRMTQRGELTQPARGHYRLAVSDGLFPS